MTPSGMFIAQTFPRSFPSETRERPTEWKSANGFTLPRNSLARFRDRNVRGLRGLRLAWKKLQIEAAVASAFREAIGDDVGKVPTLLWHARQSLMHLWLSVTAHEEEVAVLAPGNLLLLLPSCSISSSGGPRLLLYLVGSSSSFARFFLPFFFLSIR